MPAAQSVPVSRARTVRLHKPEAAVPAAPQRAAASISSGSSSAWARGPAEAPSAWRSAAW